MAVNQSLKHASLLTKLGAGYEAYGYGPAFLAYWASLGITTGTFNERMLSWINSALSASYANLPQAMQAYAVAKSANNWDSLGDLGLP